MARRRAALEWLGATRSESSFSFDVVAQAARKLNPPTPSNKAWLPPIPIEIPPQANFVTCKRGEDVNQQLWKLEFL